MFVVAVLLGSFVGITVGYVLFGTLIVAIIDAGIGWEIADFVISFLMLGGCVVPIVAPLLVTASIYDRVRRGLLTREIFEHGDVARARTCPRCAYDQTGTTGRQCPECGGVVAFPRADPSGPASAA